MANAISSPEAASRQTESFTSVRSRCVLSRRVPSTSTANSLIADDFISQKLAQLWLLDADLAIFSGLSARKAASIKEADFKRRSLRFGFHSGMISGAILAPGYKSRHELKTRYTRVSASGEWVKKD